MRHVFAAPPDARIALPDVIPEISGAVADDVVDAAVVAWSARRIFAGQLAGRVVVVASVVVDGAASSPPLHPSGYSQP
jgi:hypothetical protein